MKYLHKIKKMLCEELETISNDGGLSAGSIETLHKLTDTIKNIDKILMLEEEGGYSRDGDWEARGMYRSNNSYDDGGNSYDGGNSQRGRRRDRMGRFSRDGGNSNYSRDGYSRHDGGERMIEQLEEMMDEAEDPKEREAIKRCIQQMKQG